MLLRVDNMARGHVLAQRGDTRGKTMGRAHANLILETRLYQVEFARGVVSELTANVFAESM